MENPLSSGALIYDHEEHLHDVTCSRLPSECQCCMVSWLWAVHRLRSDDKARRSGKWMLFTRSDEVDNAWLNVVDLLASGKLGGCAKVAPKKNTKDDLHVVCIYTDDHEDVEDVFTVLHSLRCSAIPCAAQRTLNYKTDDATHAGMYTSNSSAQRAGFDATVSTSHKNQRVSKFTSPGFPGIRNVRLVLNNVGPDCLHEVVAEVPVSATAEDIQAYFRDRPRTCREIEELLQLRAEAELDEFASSPGTDRSEGSSAKKARRSST